MEVTTEREITVNNIKIREVMHGAATGMIFEMPAYRMYVPAESWVRKCTHFDFLIVSGDLLPDKMTFGDQEYIRLATLMQGGKASNGTV